MNENGQNVVAKEKGKVNRIVKGKSAKDHQLDGGEERARPKHDFASPHYWHKVRGIEDIYVGFHFSSPHLRATHTLHTFLSRLPISVPSWKWCVRRIVKIKKRNRMRENKNGLFCLRPFSQQSEGSHERGNWTEP